jgi:hypothetical protein
MRELTDKEFAAATARGEALHAAGYATRVRYEKRYGRVVVDLSNGVRLAFPPALVEGLSGLPDAALRRVEITGAGLALHWPDADVDIDVPAIMAGVFGSRRWMAELARIGGRTRTKAKAAAARKNGALGGRPKKSAA